MEIIESNMKFGEYENSHVFHLEKSGQYISLNKSLQRQGAFICEFVLLKDNALYFVEAKSSCPRTVRENISKEERSEKKRKYEEFIQQITKKMTHSIELYSSIILKRHDQAGLSDELYKAGCSGIPIKLLLVINTNGEGWLPDPELQERLRMELDFVRKMWNTRPILVMNDVKAREKKLII